MKKTIIVLAMFLCVNTASSAETNSVVIKPGDMIGDHLHKLKAYPKIEQSQKKPFGTLPTEVAMWKVGDGILQLTHTLGAGIITDMSYAVPSDGDRKTVFKVKAFNPKTGELTTLVPNKPTGGDVQ